MVVRGLRYEYLTTKAATPKAYNQYSQHVHNIVWKMAALILIHINVKLYIYVYAITASTIPLRCLNIQRKEAY